MYVKTRAWKKEKSNLENRYPNWKIEKANRSHHPCNLKKPMSDSQPLFRVRNVTLCADRPDEDRESAEKGILQILKEADEKSDFDEEELNQHMADVQQMIS